MERDEEAVFFDYDKRRQNETAAAVDYDGQRTKDVSCGPSATLRPHPTGDERREIGIIAGFFFCTLV